MDISILIVTYNSEKYIKNCLLSFLNVSLQTELIVVDNHSKDCSVDIIKELSIQYPQLNIKLLCNNLNEGFSKAMNQAFQISQGRYVMTFNPDAEMVSGTLESMVSFLESNTDAGKVGVPIQNSNGKLESPATEFKKYPSLQIIRALRAESDNKVLEKALQQTNPFEVNWLYGTGFLIKRAAIKDGFLYPEQSFLFWEEYYLSRKIISAGYKLYILPSVQIRHHASTSFKYNFSKLYMARLLSFAHEYRIRSEYYGRFNALTNMTLYAIDYGILGSYLGIKNLFKKKDPELDFTLADYKARFRSSMRILCSRNSAIEAIDVEAKNFFNSI